MKSQDRMRVVAGVGVALLVSVTVCLAEDKEKTTAPAPTTTVVAGPQYQAGPIHRFIWGSGYRKLWATPIQVEVLDLNHFSGGLTPEKKGSSGKQTTSLHFKGEDGRKWKFRSVDKDPTAVLPKSLRDTVADKVAQDQIGAAHPTGSMVVDRLAEAAGIPHVKHSLAVMPDDPRLGEFRKEFAGMLGLMEEKPSAEPPVTPGFERFTMLIDTEDLEKLLDADPSERIDDRAFLKARLLDMFVGDYDRHRDQWDWGKDKDTGRFVPVPKDRDLAMVKFDGLAISIARTKERRFVDFEDEYPNKVGLAWQSRFLDRRYLGGLEWPVWQAVIAELQAEMTDAVIQEAALRLPGTYYKQEIPKLPNRLKARRQGLPQAARRFYELLAKEAEVHGSDQNDALQISRHADGSVEIVLSGSGGLFYRRHFHPADTSEVRVYLKDGDDRSSSEGRFKAGVKVRVIGGDGNDVLDDSASGHTRFYDSSGENRVVEGPGTYESRRAYKAPVDRNGDAMRDWGRHALILPWASVGSGRGVVLGAQIKRTRYGFRKHPFAAEHVFSLGYSTRLEATRGAYEFSSARTDSRQRLHIKAEAAELDVIRFHGFGNETAQADEELFNEVRQRQLSFEPSYRFDISSVDISVGPVVKYASTPLREPSLAAIARPYGYPDYGQAGARVSFTLDRRDHLKAATKGALASVTGTFYPKAWSVKDPFGEAHGALAVYATPPVLTGPTLALRVSGQKVFGPYPFHEAAYMGGPNSIRALRTQRYAGDASLYGTAELRLPLFGREGSSRFGVFGFTDVGRVFLEGESSGRLHTGAGGGLFWTPKKPENTISAYVAQSEGRKKLRVQAGFMF